MTERDAKNRVSHPPSARNVMGISSCFRWTAAVASILGVVACSSGGSPGRDGGVVTGYPNPSSGGSTSPSRGPDGGVDAGAGGHDGGASEAGRPRGAGGSGGNAAGASGSDAGSVPASKCGDGVLDPGEQCDDGNRAEGDGCSGACTDSRACDKCFAAVLADPDMGIDQLPGFFPTCEGLQGYAPGGPAAGEPRIELCRAVYDCVLRTKCGQETPGTFDPTPCYCGTHLLDCATPGKANGPCKDDIEAGLETGDPSAITAGLSNPAFPGGLAVAALKTEGYDYTCLDACFPSPKDAGGSGGASGTGGTTGAGGTSSTGGRAASGGTSSSGGSTSAGGTTASGGASGGTSSHAAEGVLQTDRGADCVTCAQTNCPGGADSMNGSKGLAEFDGLSGDDQKLATDLFKCIFPPTGASCAALAVADCYCGTAGNDCTKPGKANGVCKGAIEAAVRSTDVTFVFQHIDDPSLPGGLATILSRCLLFGYDTLGDPTCNACFQAP